jgi:hypothetical protein
MPNVEIVTNPRRRRRRHRYTVSQLAAGFGGRRRMSRRSRRRYRRRNPQLATLAANPRRRYYYRAPRRRYYRRRRNPMLGGIGKMLNLPVAVSVGAGIVAAHVAPGLIRKVWAGAPSTGFGATAVRLGGVFALAYGVRMVTKNNQLASGMIAGAVGYELYKLADQYLLPSLGLSGLNRYITTGELESMGISGYRPTTTRLSNYAVTDEALAA